MSSVRQYLYNKVWKLDEEPKSKTYMPINNRNIILDIRLSLYDGLESREVELSRKSKLIEQRKNNLPPMNFESNEDSLDGFDLSEFNPR